MFKRNPTPRFISLSSAVIITLAQSIILAFAQLRSSQYLLFILFTLVLSYVVVYALIERFIYRKIKLIYKNIHRIKRQKDLGLTKQKEDPISDVTNSVMQWAKENKKEIDTLRKQENFRREFIGNVSHELRTPITNIQGYLHTLLDGALNDKDVNERFLNKAANSANRLVELVDDLMSINKLESGEMDLSFTRFDIHKLTQEVFEQLEFIAKERNIQLRFKSGCDKPFFVLAEKKSIKQVITNLIHNGIKYGKEGGYVAISFYDMDKNLLIEVADNGEGIEEKHLPRLFERFYRIDRHRNRDQGGSGLGLAIVKHIVEAHNQTINVRSSIGKGTTFGFTLTKG